MLQTLRRLISFGDWGRNHPSEFPGGDLDTTFDAVFTAISDLEQRLLDIRRDDGTLRPEKITLDSLDPLLAQRIADQAMTLIESRLAEVAAAKAVAISARTAAETALAAATAAANRATAAADVVVNARDPAVLEAVKLVDDAKALVWQAQALAERPSTAADDAGDSQAWAEASMLWAEHMPDTLPRNSLVWQDISGDHWSARWWANKATAAFGMLTALYLGAHSEPPTSNLNGGPIEIGSIYYDIDTHQPYVWDGTSWHSFWAPSRALTAALWYRGSAGQTEVVTSTPDMNGDAYTITSEAVEVHVNGIKLTPDQGGPEGDYLYDQSLSKVTFLRPLRVGDIVNVDVLIPPENLQPVSARLQMLVDISPQFDGVKTTFTLQKPGGSPVLPAAPEGILVSLDGVWQQAGWAYSITGGSNITFAEAPQVNSKCFIVFMLPIEAP